MARGESQRIFLYSGKDGEKSNTYYFAKYHYMLFFASKHIKKNTNLTLSIEYISIRFMRFVFLKLNEECK